MKIAIIGAGNVGSAAAYAMTIKGLAAEIHLIDVDEKREAGEVMDIADGLCFVETGSVKGANFKDAKNADLIIVTAGARQKPGETRLDLVNKNKKIMDEIFKSIGQIKKSAVVLVISNPVDVLTYHIQQLTKLPPNQIFGSGTSLDTARLKTALGRHFGVSPHEVNGYVLGEHGDSEFVAWSTVSIAGIPIAKMKGWNKTLAKKIEDHVRREAYEIISHKGATYYGIGLVISDITEAILYDQKVVMPVTGRLNGWNGVTDICLGAPAVIGKSGIEKHWPLALPADEKKKLSNSAKVIKGYLE